jgi:RHS repeat-associated protein
MFTSRVSTASGTTTGLPAGLAPTAISYFNHDHLGSIVAITNEAGVVVERLAFDPWGKRRFTNGTPDTLDTLSGQLTHRGYTMHEHLEDMGIIHMNGRIYDPLIGRFMSADPYIQDASDLQSYNRYSYVRNNPMNLTDPSGYFSISKIWKKVWRSPIFKAIVTIVVAVYAPYLLNYLAPSLFAVSGSLLTSVATGALSGFAGTGTLKGALTGAFTAGIMFGAGEIGQALNLESGGIGKIALHAGAGCLSGMAGGGSCKSGAMAGALGEFGNNIDVGNSLAANVTKSAMLGGLGSKVSGGKFADGAQTGAFGYLFNELLHSGNRSEAMKRAGYADGGCSHPCDPPLVGVYGEGLIPIARGLRMLLTVANDASTFFDGATLHDRVVGQMKGSDNHAFPASVDTFAAESGVLKTVKDSRNNNVQMLTVGGAYKGADGTFEYIKNQSNQIYHRFFNKR